MTANWCSKCKFFTKSVSWCQSNNQCTPFQRTNWKSKETKMDCNKTKECDNYKPTCTICDNFEPALPTLPEGATRLGDLEIGDLWVLFTSGCMSNNIKCVRDDGRSYYLLDNNVSGITDPNTPVYCIKATYRLM